jgi:hypothetical protein
MDLPLMVYGALGAAFVLFLFARFWSMPGVTRLMRRKVWCPMHDRTFPAELEEEVWDAKRVDVKRCDAFDPPEAVACGKACLRVTERPAPEPRGGGAWPPLTI